MAAMVGVCGEIWCGIMIRVRPYPEPDHFHSCVRVPGQAFLAKVPNPTNKHWKDNQYWKEVANDMYAAYDGMCAYTGMFIPRGIATPSIDHFKPKSKYPALAYEWTNYRLALAKINQYKGDEEGLVDPFEVPRGWFVLDFPSCVVKPGNGLTSADRDKVWHTISVLKLNDDDGLVQLRCDIILELISGNITLQYVTKYYPFLAVEVERQGGVQAIARLFRRKTK